MLPKKNRLPRKVFSELISDSKYVNSPVFSLRFKVSPSIKSIKFGVSVSKKISKSAVVRNTIRRRVYSCLKPSLSKISNGIFLFVAKKGSDKLKGEKLRDEIEKLLSQSGQLS